jgi:hypothetical protein
VPSPRERFARGETPILASSCQIRKADNYSAVRCFSMVTQLPQALYSTRVM